MTPYFRALLSMVLILMAAASDSSQAGTARSVALGEPGGFLDDCSNVLQWYSSLVDYPDLLILELGDVINGQDEALARQGLIGHGAGGHVQLDSRGKFGTLAVYFQDHLEYGPTDGAFSGFWARKIGSYRLGISGRFSTFGESRVGTWTGDRIDSQYLHQYGLGLGKKFSDRFDVEVAGEILNTKFSSGGALYNQPPTDNWSSFGFRIRAHWALREDMILVPVIDHRSYDRLTFDRTWNWPVGQDFHTTELGTGLNLRPDDDHLVSLSLVYRTGNEALDGEAVAGEQVSWSEGERDFYHLHFRAAVEWSVAPWATLRACGQYLRINQDEVVSGTVEDPGFDQHFYEKAVTPLSLGFGLHHQGFTVDFAYNDTAPLPATNWSSADYGNGGQGVSSVTLVWGF